MRTAKCRGCGAEIVWIPTLGGKSMPCDAEPVYYKMQAKGPEKIVTPNGVVISCVRTNNPNEATGAGYVPHWATCPRAGDFKRGGRT